MRPHIRAGLPAAPRITARIVAPLVFGFVSACGALDQFEHTMMDEATIPGTVGQGAFGLMYGSSFNGVNLSSSQSFANAGVTADDVDAIYLKSARVEGTHAATDRLDALFNSIVLWVEAPGVARQPIASKYMMLPSSNQTTLDVVFEGDQTEAVNLKPFAIANSMTVGMDVNIKQQPAFDTTLRTTIVLLVDINLAGL